MSQPIDDGGPAFPIPASESNYYQEGMALRDWFAGHALAGNLAYPCVDSSPESEAIMAYRYADAMLAARKGGAE